MSGRAHAFRVGHSSAQPLVPNPMATISHPLAPYSLSPPALPPVEEALLSSRDYNGPPGSSNRPRESMEISRRVSLAEVFLPRRVIRPHSHQIGSGAEV